MADAKHTPGPWAVVDGRNHQEWQNFAIRPAANSKRSQVSIASVPKRGTDDGRGHQNGDGEANARLIAAAPELLAALIHAINESKAHPSRSLDEAGFFVLAHAAVAKATGGHGMTSVATAVLPPLAERIRTPLDALAWALDRISDRGDYWQRATELLDAGRAAVAEENPQRPLSQVATLMRQRDGWRDEAEHLKRRLRSAESDIDAMHKHQTNDVWHFQGDGFDHIESMATDMVVVIHAADLRALIAAGQPTGGTT